MTKKLLFIWGPKQQAAFQRLKEAFTKGPVLIRPNYNEPFVLETDASDYALGAILSQETEGKDGIKRLHPIAYWSATLTATERNYPATEKELYAIVRAL